MALVFLLTTISISGPFSNQVLSSPRSELYTRLCSHCSVGRARRINYPSTGIVRHKIANINQVLLDSSPIGAYELCSLQPPLQAKISPSRVPPTSDVPVSLKAKVVSLDGMSF